MNYVGSLELRKELFELSGWGNTYQIYPDVDDTFVEVYPAYSLGFLLRKLPEITLSHIEGFEWRICFKNDPGIYADTPEDAACMLLIKLIKQGVIKP